MSGQYYEKADETFRLLGFADEIAARNDHRRAIDHKGWFVDEFQGEVMRGVVYKLARGRGYMVGYADPWNNGAAFLEHSTAEDDMQAAREADHIAEREAEKERDYQEARQKGRYYAERLPEDIAETRGRFLAIARSNPKASRVATIRRVLDELAEEWCELRTKRAKLWDEWHNQAGFSDV